MISINKLYLISLFSLAAIVSSDMIELHYEIVEESEPSEIGNLVEDSSLKSTLDNNSINQLHFAFIQDNKHWYRFFSLSLNGTLATNASLDRESLCGRKDECLFSIKVTARGLQTFHMLQVHIRILDINDHRPSFSTYGTGLTEKISEENKLGTLIRLPLAGDEDSEIFGIKDYKLITKHKFFSLRPRRRNKKIVGLSLLVNASLDRETLDHYEMRLIAIDRGIPPKEGSLNISLSVQDINDNSPRFSRSKYNVTIKEATKPGTLIDKVTAMDADIGTNAEILYQFSMETQKTLGRIFTIDAETGSIFLQAKLDSKESSKYDMIITASDRGLVPLQSETELTVNIIDGNNHKPVISISSLLPRGSFVLTESAPVGTPIALISVTDADVGKNAQVRCHCNNSGLLKLTKVGESDFQLITVRQPDREMKTFHVITLICSDSGIPTQTSSVSFTLTIKDINDNPPKFKQRLYRFNIQENNRIGAFVGQVFVTDPDAGSNSLVSFVLDPTALSKMRIDASGNLWARTVFDREKQSVYTFTVKARDGGEPKLESTAQIHVTVTDSNDQKPVFQQQTYTFDVPENKQPGFVLGQVKAFDKDSEEYNHFFYKFHKTRPEFGLNKYTGTVYTKRSLDRENKEMYMLNVIAIDTKNASLISMTRINVFVVDENDNSPTITYPKLSNISYPMHRDIVPGTQILKVEAHDRDLGDNGRIRFSITKGNEGYLFRINPQTGVIFLHKFPPKYKQNRHLGITVSDHGKPQRHTTIDIIIKTKQPEENFLAMQDGSGTTSLLNMDTILVIICSISSLIIIFLIIIIVMIKRNRCCAKRTPPTIWQEEDEEIPPPEEENKLELNEFNKIYSDKNALDASMSSGVQDCSFESTEWQQCPDQVS